MRLYVPFASAALLVALAVPQLAAVQLQEVKMISPITGKPFTAMVVPPDAGSIEHDPSVADMGADDDGCRHSSGLSEYDYYVATDPYSYFSALAVEWDDRNGRFRGEISPELKEWTIKQFNTEWQLDHNNAFRLAAAEAKQQGRPDLERDQFVMSQQAIPVHRKYLNALTCYEKRGARSAVLAKIALTGAWALRVRFNVPINHPQLAGGIEEINDRLARYLKDNEVFDARKWAEVYKKIYEKPEVKTDEAILLAGLVYHGFLVRTGDQKAANEVLESLVKRFEKTEKGGELLRGLSRERKEAYHRYRTLLELAGAKFIDALQEEEFSRPRLPEVLLVVAEALRRTDHPVEAAQWYLCLAQMPETQPKLRADIRSAGKAPGPEAPYHVQLGWIADIHLAQLKEQGTEIGDVPAGVNAKLLNAILFDGFGTADYKNPSWKPIVGATQKDCYMVLDQVGKSVLEYHLRLGGWPATLDDLWTRDVVRDRNLLNRFYDPISGKPLRYETMSGEVAQRTALVTTPEAIPTTQGPRFGAYLANNQIVWSEHEIKPGDIVAK
jgi:hypothetical protein